METPVTDALHHLAEKIGNMTPAAQRNLAKELHKAGMLAKTTKWTPQPGPQTEALYNTADLLLYGGAAGGGKSSLIAGLALNEHTRVQIFRQQVGELQGLMDEIDRHLVEAKQKPISRANNVWRGPNGKVIEFGHLEKPGSERNWQGREGDLKAFDEAANIHPAKILYVLSWLRSSKKGQRKRAILASNPPMGGVGDYLLDWFGPWIDPTHELYGTVQPGELLWAYFEGQGDNITSVWVKTPTKEELRELEKRMETALKEGDMAAVMEIKLPRSRTFIPAQITDNKYIGPEYMAEIASKPEPLRTALLTGDFFASKQDEAMQVIPSAWVEMAFDRWDERYDTNVPMIQLATDVCGSVNGDNQVSAGLRENWCFDPLIVTQGADLLDPSTGVISGRMIAMSILSARRNSAALTLDCTGGWGNSASDYIEENHKGELVGRFVFSEQTGGTSRDGTFRYANARADAWWSFRESLDPDSNNPDEMPALPRDSGLKRELCMPLWDLKARSTILIESKDDIRTRLGRSTDRADAVIMAWANRKVRGFQKAMRRAETHKAKPMRDPRNIGQRPDSRRAKPMRKPF